MKKTISIIIPTYNSIGNLSVILKDIFNQVNNLDVCMVKNVEIIVIDDGSTDGTYDYLLGLKGSDFNINFCFFRINNSGAAKARNFGLDKASGEYVFFCDADDIPSKNFLNNFFDFDFDFDILYFSSEVISTSGDYICHKVFFDKNKLLPGRGVLYDKLTINQWTSAVWTYIFRRDLVEETNAFFTSRIAHEDHLFTVKLFLASKKIFTTSSVFYKQVVTEGSLTRSNKNNDYFYSRVLAARETIDFIKSVDNKLAFKYFLWSVRSIIQLCKEYSFHRRPMLIFFMMRKVIFKEIKYSIGLLRWFFLNEKQKDKKSNQ